MWAGEELGGGKVGTDVASKSSSSRAVLVLLK